jgi:hypothetical protein
MTSPGRNRTNLRSILGFAGGYESINREERNLVAILYHLLMDQRNLERMLTLVASSQAVAPEVCAVFFEYAFVRDLWSTQVRDESTARRCLDEFLRPPLDVDLGSKSIAELNRFFGVSGVPSATEIQMPARWSISKFQDSISDNEFFSRVCKFKWAFNAKPDLVIHTTPDTAICIEAKLGSREGLYPSSLAERNEFRRRNLELVSQTELQRFILEDVLGLTAEFVFLVKRTNRLSVTHRPVTWRQVFATLDSSSAPPFVRRWLKHWEQG